MESRKAGDGSASVKQRDEKRYQYHPQPFQPARAASDAAYADPSRSERQSDEVIPIASHNSAVKCPYTF